MTRNNCKNIKQYLIMICIMMGIACCVLGMNRIVASAQASTYILSDYFEGGGSYESPYLIYDEEDLRQFAKIVNQGQNLTSIYFALERDIYVSSDDWQPIGKYVEGLSFDGILDGMGHTITVKVCDDKNAALFENLDGMVKNLCINGTFIGERNSASISNYGGGQIVNCCSNAFIQSKTTNGFSAGIVNHWTGEIINVCFSGEINGERTDEIVNTISSGIKNAYANGRIIKDAENFTESKDLYEVLKIFNDASRDLFITSDIRGNMLWDVNEGKLRLSHEFADFEGVGSVSNPFIIKNEYDLQTLAYYSNIGYNFSNMYFKQVNDIVIDSVEWNPIAINGVAPIPFYGNYNGNGHKLMFNNNDDSTVFTSAFDGKILNIDICSQNIHTNNVCVGVFFSENAKIINCLISNSKDNNRILADGLLNDNIKSLYLEGIIEPGVGTLNDNLETLMITEGIHAGEIYKWSEDERGKPSFDISFEKEYLSDGFYAWEGRGTEANPFIISSLDDLIKLREELYYGRSYWLYNFRQRGNIDISSLSENWCSFDGFAGTYDGDGYRIVGFKSNNNQAARPSFWGSIRGNIQNFILEVEEVENTSDSILANYSSGIIVNCIVICKDDSHFEHFFVNTNVGKIQNSYLLIQDETQNAKITNYNTGEINNSSVLSIERAKSLNVYELNEKTLEAVYVTGRGINTVNSWIFDDEIPVPRIKNYRESNMWYRFFAYVFRNSVILWGSLVWLFGIIVVYAYRWKNNYFGIAIFYDDKKLIELFIITVLWLLFYVTLKNIVNVDFSNRMKMITIVALLLAILILLFWIFHRNVKCSCTKIHFLLFEHMTLIAGIVIVILLILPQFRINPAYDSDLYYGDFVYGLDNYDGTFLGLFSAFKAWGKAILLQSILWGMGEYLFPGTSAGIYLGNMILLLLAQVAVYQIIGRVFPNLIAFYRGILAFIFALLPYVGVGVIYTNPDFSALMFFTYIVWCFMFNYNLLGFICIYGLTSSKLNMIVIYSAFLFIDMIMEYRKDRRSVISTYPIFLRTCPIIITVYVYYFVLKYNVHTSASLQKTGYILLDNDRITTLLLQNYGYGFVWLINLLLVIVFLRAKIFKYELIGDRKVIFALIASSVLNFLILVILYTMAPCPRYFAITMLMNIIMFAFVIANIKNKIIKTAILIFFAAIIFIQQLYTIDPMIKSLGRRKNIGGWHLITINIGDSVNWGDLSAYNLEYSKASLEASKIYEFETDGIFLEGGGLDTYSLGITNSQIYPIYYDCINSQKTYKFEDNNILLETFICNMNATTKYKFLDKSKISLLCLDYEKSWVVDWLESNGYKIMTQETNQGFDRVMIYK